MGSPRITLSAIRQFLGAFVAYAGRRGVLALALVTVGAFVEGAGILLIIPLLAIVVQNSGHGGTSAAVLGALFAFFGVQSILGKLALLLAVFAAVMALRAVVVVWRDVVLTKLQIGFVECQRSTLMEQLAAARWDQVVGMPHARVTHLLGSDIQRISMACYVSIQCSVSAALLLIHAGLAVVLSPVLAVVALGLQVIGFAAILPSLNRARQLGQYLTSSNQQLNAAATQFLGGLKLAKSQNLEGRFAGHFWTILAQATERQVGYIRHQTGARMAANTLMALAGAALMLIGFGVLHIAAPVLITLLFVIARMGGPAQQLQTGAQQLAVALPSFEAIEALRRELANDREILSPVAVADALLAAPIVFERVWFRHQEGDNGSLRGVKDLTLTITQGEFVGISGPSGAGKTTFCDLLTGLFPPQQGRVRIGDHTLNGDILAAWRARLAYVAQDPFLFHESVRWNLSWSAPHISEAEMWEALAAVGADGLVQGMAQGLDTLVGERGSLVSGGERQRLALAGAILRRPKMLVLDEATSAIDIDSERAILRHLLQLSPKPTIIMVAHRPESLALCDRILTIGAPGSA